MYTDTSIDATHMDQEHSCSSDQHLPISGVSTERVDPQTLYAVSQLFPAPTNGLEFLALLLRLAMVKQLALAGIGIADVAEITVESIRQLAKKIGLSYETTHKYVVLFCALGLLIKVRENGMVKLRFPLCRYQPPLSLQQLDALITKARPKVVSCAKGVKRRFLTLYGSPQITTPENAISTMMIAPESESLLLVTRVQEALLDLHALTTNPEAIALQEQLTTIMVKLEQSISRFPREISTPESEHSRLPGLAEKNGRLLAKTVDSLTSTVGEDGRLSPRMVDSPPANPTPRKLAGRLSPQESTGAPINKDQNGRLFSKTVDSLTNTGREDGRLSPRAVDFLQALQINIPSSDGRLSAKMVDSPPANSTPRKLTGRLSSQESTVAPINKDQDGRLFSKTVDSLTSTARENSRLSAKMVDSSPKMVDSSSPVNYNVNVNVIIKNIFNTFNVNVKPAIEYLRELFQEPESKRGYYYQLHKSTCTDPQIWLAAAIETFIAMQRTSDKVSRPGGYFYGRVAAMSTTGIPPTTAQLVQRYAKLSYAQLQEALRQEHEKKATSELPRTPSQTPQVTHTLSQASQSPRKPRPSGPKIELHLPRNSQQHGMTIEELNRLREEIRAHKYTDTWYLVGYRQDDDSYALLVENILLQQQWVYTPSQWQQTLIELFPPIVQPQISQLVQSETVQEKR